MQFKDGTHVFTADNQDVGTVDRIVIDPRTDELTHIVVQQGFLFTEDKVVPIELVASANEDRIVLRPDAGDLEHLPPFEEQYYARIDEAERQARAYPGTGYVSPVFGYPPYGAAWPVYPGVVGAGYAGVGQPEGQFVERTELNIPDHTAALKKGARVISADDQHVGEIESVLVDKQSSRATHFVISQGLLFKDHKLVPADWIKVTGENEVFLSVHSKTLEGLPDYQPQ